MTQQAFRFDGPALRLEDVSRLQRQLSLVRGVMGDGAYRTLAQIAALVGAPEASVSARLRQLRSHGYTVDRRRVPETNGLHEYRVRM